MHSLTAICLTRLVSKTISTTESIKDRICIGWKLDGIDKKEDTTNNYGSKPTTILLGAGNNVRLLYHGDSASV